MEIEQAEVLVTLSGETCGDQTACERRPAGVRAPIVAKKAGKLAGAKGRRKVKAKTEHERRTE